MCADKIDYVIEGDYSPMLTITLDPGEAVQAEAGAVVMMEDGVAMQTEMAGGLLGGLMRKVSGENFFMPYFTNQASSPKRVSFASSMPGQVVPVNLTDHGGVFLCQRDAYLCSAKGIEISIALTKKLSSGLFGGEGLVLQELKGDGLAFLSAGGTLVQRDLRAGESLTVGTGCVVGFAKSCDYSITFQKGVKNLIFGGEGLFLTKLTGPGRVIIQTQPVAQLALALSKYMPSAGE
ncbi:MAG: TIGR00266 family protein [Alphaproteobacteria bacterium RIFOXYD12_FULL_60_8]|nr:MAG: TIGR00266 family protein [Alphaproteobacteria bacterium RIFOXYD12_FULL_60_8]